MKKSIRTYSSLPARTGAAGSYHPDHFGDLGLLGFGFFFLKKQGNNSASFNPLLSAAKKADFVAQVLDQG